MILSFRLGPRGTWTVTMSPRLWPTSALPTGDSLESLFSEGRPRRDPTMWYMTDWPDFWSLTQTLVPDRDHAGVDRLLVDHGRVAQLVLERGDARLEHRLLVLGVVVLGVLADVAELARLLDALGDLAALRRAEVLDLGS